jgi:4-hydroxy-tetrahydrodipicolinate synthase
MVTPLRADGSLDAAGAAALASYLVDEQGNDGLVVNGTTGESPTTSDAEKEIILRTVIEAVGGRARVIAGVGTNDTHHTIDLARTAEKAGADALLAVTPYYNKPPQAGLVAHFTALADATGLPVMLYDIPGRTGTPIATESLCRLAEHERIIAVKDAKGSPAETSWVTRRTDLAIYSGDDILTLPLLAVGAVGVVGVVTHVFGRQSKAMIEAFERGDVSTALHLHHQLLPAFTGFFITQGVITTKAVLNLLNRPAGPVRAPLIDATEEQIAALRRDCALAGLDLPELVR